MSMPFNRISGRKGSEIRLDMKFYRNGILTDPYAIRRINIYKTSRSDSNLLATIDITDPDSSIYPSPLGQELDSASSSLVAGSYYYDFDIPDDFDAPEVYIDEWFFIGDELINSSGSSVIDDETVWDSQCGKFWVIPGDGWFLDDSLLTARFGFEPLDVKFIKPEVRNLEVGIIPLPLYDYDCNLISQLMPYLNAFITIKTVDGCDTLVDDAPMKLALRQGTFRSSPFVARYLLDTTSFVSGTYRYNIRLELPNGESRVSSSSYLTISSR